MKVLVACESSGAVRDSFRLRGHDAWSVDLLADEAGSQWHMQGDALEAVRQFRPDLLIAHPPCTYLCASGLHWNKRRPGREQKTAEALGFVHALLDSPVERIAIENRLAGLARLFAPPISMYSRTNLATMRANARGYGLRICRRSCRLLTSSRALSMTALDGQTKPTADRTDYRPALTDGASGAEPIRALPRRWPSSGET